MKVIKHSIEILMNADEQVVFKNMIDVKRWSQWTKSVIAISYLGEKDLVEGSRLEIKQPKFSPAIWTIEKVIPNSFFSWSTKVFGVRNNATHSFF